MSSRPNRHALITSVEAAELLERDPRTVRAWITLGRLRGEQIGRRWWTTIASVDALRARLMPARRDHARA